MLLTGGSVPKGLESPMKKRKVIRIIDIVRKENDMTDKEKLDAIRAEIHRLVDVRGYDREMANDLFAFMDSLPNKPVSEGLEEAAKLHVIETRDEDVVWDENARCAMLDFKAGAEWQQEKEYTCYEEAFEDGAKWKKEQINEVLLSEVLPCFMHGGEADEVVAKLDEVLNQKK
jgi:hypothetical protein